MKRLTFITILIILSTAFAEITADKASVEKNGCIYDIAIYYDDEEGYLSQTVEELAKEIATEASKIEKNNIIHYYANIYYSRIATYNVMMLVRKSSSYINAFMETPDGKNRNILVEKELKNHDEAKILFELACETSYNFLQKNTDN